MAISPTVNKLLLLIRTYGFKLYNIDDLSSSKCTTTLECGVKVKHLYWSISISNRVDDDKNELLIAFSDVKILHYYEEENDSDFCGEVNNQYGDDKNDLDFGNKVNN
ncbi:hypothetical protein Glove_469g30 [Diversispora epigaea]|uniref:Uncharacterized protein n=1 Tax=Diversispora epigaea TaxID=1348612 RepID=A0A397GRZ7_9GLOM|nr:hypothetical protein Glove_469g30 [Diversispora epigaea]